jgi:hypothetical protein
MNIVVTGRLVFLLSGSSAAKLLAMAMLAVSYPQVYWAGQGLETPLVAFLLSVNLLCILDVRWRRALPAVSAALVLVRPEGVVYLSIVFAWGAWSRYRGDKLAWRQMWQALGVAALTLLAVTGWRVWYFGDFVIHPFYFKSSHLGSLGSLQLLIDANRHLRLDLLLAPVAVAILSRKLPAPAWLLIIVVALQLIWFAALRDHFPFERHLVPGLPALYALSAIALWCLIRHFSMAVRNAVFATASLIPMLALIQYPGNPLYQLGGLFVQEPVAFSRAVVERFADPDALPADRVDVFLRANRKMMSIGHNWESAPGRLLKAIYPAGSVIAYHEMGQAPFYAGQDKKFIDTAGLVTRDIGFYKFQTSFDERPLMGRFWELRCAVLAKTGRGSCPSVGLESALDYILNREPDVIIKHDVIAGLIGVDMPPQALLKDERFLRLYRLRYIIDNAIRVYERRDRSFPVFEGDIPGVNIRHIP